MSLGAILFREKIKDTRVFYQWEWYGELYVPIYIQVCGDSVISCMTYDNPFPGLFPPKGYVENMKGVKYEILDYQQSKTRRGRRFVSFGSK